uniref:Uncharacterized protein n=1 Tax=Cannabis sativa TaxID=3483 RepID=A0A803PUT8_CANSA
MWGTWAQRVGRAGHSVRARACGRSVGVRARYERAEALCGARRGAGASEGRTGTGASTEREGAGGARGHGSPYVLEGIPYVELLSNSDEEVPDPWVRYYQSLSESLKCLEAICESQERLSRLKGETEFLEGQGHAHMDAHLSHLKKLYADITGKLAHLERIFRPEPSTPSCLPMPLAVESPIYRPKGGGSSSHDPSTVVNTHTRLEVELSLDLN